MALPCSSTGSTGISKLGVLTGGLTSSSGVSFLAQDRRVRTAQTVTMAEIIPVVPFFFIKSFLLLTDYDKMVSANGLTFQLDFLPAVSYMKRARSCKRKKKILIKLEKLKKAI
jgi:hypothetical protein